MLIEISFKISKVIIDTNFIYILYLYLFKLVFIR